MSFHRTRNLYEGAYLLSQGSPFPTQEHDELGRRWLVFDDPEGSVARASHEFRADNPDGTRALVSASRLFEAFDILKRSLGPKPEARR